MSTNHKPLPDEVEHLLRNAELRNELEPYYDESLRSVNVEELPTPVENEFLASMLAWERAPILPISQWFDPELKLPHPDAISNEQLHDLLWETIHKLFDRRIVLDFTDHLSDRDLYCLVYRDILPSSEKKIDSPTNFLHWDAIRPRGCAFMPRRRSARPGSPILPTRCRRPNCRPIRATCPVGRCRSSSNVPSRESRARTAQRGVTPAR